MLQQLIKNKLKFSAEKNKAVIAKKLQSAVCMYNEAWPVVHDARDSAGLPYFRVMFVSRKAVTPDRACQHTSCLCHCFNLHSRISLTAA